MNVTLLPHQYKALTGQGKFKALISGIGAGKTWCGVHWILSQANKYPKALGFIGATTYSQLRNSTLTAVFNEFMRLEIPFNFNQSTGILEFLGCKVLCKSMENYEPLRGIEVGYIWLDEAAFMKEDAYNVITGRLRDKKGNLEMLITSSPNGFNWVYEHFVGEKKTKDHVIIKAKSKDNCYLPDGYIESLKEQYDEKLVEQELNGEFVNLTAGRAYYAFEVENNVKEFDFLKSIPLNIGTDFNCDPSTSIVGQYVNSFFYVWDELFLRNSDTYKLCHELKSRKYTGTIYPDSTGGARKTSGKSDFEILRSEGFLIEKTYNPLVRDRVNNINRLLSHKRIIIHPRCVKLIGDLEKVSWKDGQLDQKTDPLLTHLSDCLSYWCWKVAPLTSSRKSKQRII